MYKKVGNTEIKTRHKATCHCGEVELELLLPRGIEDPRRCNCSMCRRKGAITGFVKLEDLFVVKGEECLSCYQFNTKAAKHYFCSNCGIYTHHQRRINPTECGFNVGCLEGVNPSDLGEVVISDGINHPADRGN